MRFLETGGLLLGLLGLLTLGLWAWVWGLVRWPLAWDWLKGPSLERGSRFLEGLLVAPGLEVSLVGNLQERRLGLRDCRAQSD